LLLRCPFFEGAIVIQDLAQFIQYMFFAKGSFMLFLLSSS
jgi:hypothetical protein